MCIELEKEIAEPPKFIKKNQIKSRDIFVSKIDNYTCS